MFSVLLLFLATIVARGYSKENLCPPPEQITPCTCFKAKVSARWTALCQSITTASVVTDVFDNNPKWSFQDMHIDKCTMSYIPAIMLERARFQSMNVSNSVLTTLFDEAPKKTPELNLYLHNLRLQRGFEWKLFSNSSLKDFGAFNTEIRYFGSSFKDGMPNDVERIWFEGTKTRSIKSQAFENLKILEILAIKRSMLRTLSRNMFPKPWKKLKYLDFSFNRISSLPEDIFDDMPKLGIFIFEKNLITTLSEKIFDRRFLWALEQNPLNCNCDMKWITTSTTVNLLLLKGTCVKPNNLKGKKLEKLTKNNFSYCT